MKLTKNYELFPPGICFADAAGAAASAAPGATPGAGGPGAGAGGGSAPPAGAGAAPGAAPGGGAPWYEAAGLDDDGKRFVAGKNFPDLKTTVRSHIEADKLARERNVIEKPDPTKLNEWKGWSELGWIEDPSKYVFQQPDKAKLPPGVTYSGELMDKLRGAAHAARVPLAAAQQIHDQVWSYLLEGVQKLEADGARGRQELETKLRGTWGLDYARNAELARRAAAAFNPTPEDTSLIGKILGEPALMQMFHKIGEQIGEAHLPAEGAGAGTAAGGLPPTIAATEAELNRIEADPGFLKVLNDNRHPQHKDFVAQRQRLIGHLARLQSRAA